MQLLHSQPDNADEQLRQWFADPLTEWALYSASPNLHQVWRLWQQDGKQRPTLAACLALWRYAIRMSSRSTPFGVMAGVSKLSISEQTEGKIDADKIAVNVRPDSGWLVALAEQLTKHPDVRWQLYYQVNNSLYSLGSQLRYSDYTVEQGHRAFFINAIEPDETILGVLQYVRSKVGGVVGQDLRSWIEQLGEEPANARQLVDELIEAHILVSELEPGVTGKDAFENLIQQLPSSPNTDGIGRALAALQKRLLQPFESVEKEQQLDRDLQRVVGGVNTRQLDLYRPVEKLKLGQKVVRQIGQELAELSALRLNRQAPALSTFAQRFYTRYGMQPQPLLVALDHESGIGYAANTDSRTGHLALLRTLTDHENLTTAAQSDRLDNLRLNKLTQFLRTGESVQEITEQELTEAAKSTSSTPMAHSWAVLGDLYSTSGEAADQGDYQFLVKNVTGSSGASLMARFGSGDEEIAKAIQQVTDWEANQYSDAVLAEIVHLPAGRIGNVVHRPALRAYEIPYVTPASVDEEHTLLLEDLWVRVSTGATVELWSKKHNRRVIPRNTTAHNYHHSDEVYRFLSDLSHQEESFTQNWSWGLLSDQPRLPRVVYKHLIVARAQWKLTMSAQWTSAQVMVDELRQHLVVPQLVTLVERDNELLLDLDVVICRQLLFDEIRKKKSVRLVEWLAHPDQCWVQRGGQPYTAELLIPFRNSWPAPGPPPYSSPFVDYGSLAVQRTYLPGSSEWLYVKVYVGEQTANDVLTQVVAPLVNQAIRQGWVDHWFFIRYYDPQPHLRLRFHCPDNNYEYVLNELSDELKGWVDNGRVQTVRIETYERELERYGHLTITHCERLFWLDSVDVVQRLFAEQDAEEDRQWLMACRRADTLIEAFALSLSEKHQLMTVLQAKFLHENKTTPELRSQLNEQFRLWSARLAEQGIEWVESSTEINDQIRSIVESLVGTLRQQRVESPSLTDLLTSLLHMQCNRFFISEQRLCETVVYHFLLRQYKSALAKQQDRQNTNSQQATVLMG
jgi:lantibiotic biosynthesis protein